jgi:hypothetical protein
LRNFEQAGLIAYADDDFARLSHVAIWNTRQLEFGRELPRRGRESPATPVFRRVRALLAEAEDDAAGGDAEPVRAHGDRVRGGQDLPHHAPPGVPGDLVTGGQVPAVGLEDVDRHDRAVPACAMRISRRSAGVSSPQWSLAKSSSSQSR